jgi:hypothetical protein
MKSLIATNAEPRKEWVSPELKKIDVEEITAAGSTVAGEGFGFS